MLAIMGPRLWVCGYSLFSYFNFSVELKIFKIKYEENIFGHTSGAAQWRTPG